MNKNIIDYDNFTVDELYAYRELQKKVQLPILDFEQMANFPPLCLWPNRAKSELFMKEAWELWNAGNDLLLIRLPDNFRPYAELEKKYSKEIAEARKYIKDSAGNMDVALDMYYKANPDVEIDPSDVRF